MFDVLYIIDPYAFLIYYPLIYGFFFLKFACVGVGCGLVGSNS